MLLKLSVIYCSIAISFAWLPPERCQQGNFRGRSSAAAGTEQQATVVSKIDTIATEQHEVTKETYKKYEFYGIPITARTTKLQDCFPLAYEVTAPFDCSFHTYDPELLSSVACSDSTCKLSHSVSTVATYTASEGYNWGVKFTTKSKASFFGNSFEIGGEASTGGSYSCTYTRGRTVTDLVECSRSTPSDGQLHLYNVRTDMMCNFGKVRYESEVRDNNTTVVIPMLLDFITDIDKITDSALISVKVCGETLFLLDTDKISDRVLQKILKKAPHFNPYTDLIKFIVRDEFLVIYYYKKISSEEEYRSIIPFTNQAGNSVYQYACVWTPK